MKHRNDCIGRCFIDHLEAPCASITLDSSNSSGSLLLQLCGLEVEFLRTDGTSDELVFVSRNPSTSCSMTCFFVSVTANLTSDNGIV